MSKEYNEEVRLQTLKEFVDEYANEEELTSVYGVRATIDIIEEQLNNYKKLLNVNPSEALECLERLEYYHIRSVNDLGCREHRLKDINTIKAALLKEKFFDNKLVFKNGCMMSGFGYKGKQIVAMPLEEYDKFMKQENTLEIIKQIITKTEDTLQDILRCKDYEEYKGLWYFQTSLNEEEFNILKEVLE